MVHAPIKLRLPERPEPLHESIFEQVVHEQRDEMGMWKRLLASTHGAISTAEMQPFPLALGSVDHRADERSSARSCWVRQRTCADASALEPFIHGLVGKPSNFRALAFSGGAAGP